MTERVGESFEPADREWVGPGSVGELDPEAAQRAALTDECLDVHVVLRVVAIGRQHQPARPVRGRSAPCRSQDHARSQRASGAAHYRPEEVEAVVSLAGYAALVAVHAWRRVDRKCAAATTTATRPGEL